MRVIAQLQLHFGNEFQSEVFMDRGVVGFNPCHAGAEQGAQEGSLLGDCFGIQV